MDLVTAGLLDLTGQARATRTGELRACLADTAAVLAQHRPTWAWQPPAGGTGLWIDTGGNAVTLAVRAQARGSAPGRSGVLGLQRVLPVPAAAVLARVGRTRRGAAPPRRAPRRGLTAQPSTVAIPVADPAGEGKLRPFALRLRSAVRRRAGPVIADRPACGRDRVLIAFRGSDGECWRSRSRHGAGFAWLSGRVDAVVSTSWRIQLAANRIFPPTVGKSVGRGHVG
jgi:hypothetical protein